MVPSLGRNTAVSKTYVGPQRAREWKVEGPGRTLTETGCGTQSAVYGCWTVRLLRVFPVSRLLRVKGLQCLYASRS